MTHYDSKYNSLRLLSCGNQIENALVILKQLTNWEEDFKYLDNLKDKIYEEYFEQIKVTPQDKG
jgi:hypothetical protein